jgi:hypothetical protein
MSASAPPSPSSPLSSSAPRSSASRVFVASHGHCFDGLASAVAFASLLRTLRPEIPLSSYSFRACDYRPGDSSVPESALVGEENAILDFRYTKSDKLTFYFDHHATAFSNDEQRAFFEKHPERHFHDPSCSSCAKLLRRAAPAAFGVSLEHLAPLLDWADIIDAARYESPESAVLRLEPELTLLTAVEATGDDAFYRRLVPRLLEAPLAEVAADPDIVQMAKPLQEKRSVQAARVARRASRAGVVVVVDLSDGPTEVGERFAAYLHHPDALYSVTLSHTSSQVRMSIGQNPWANVPARHHIGALCERFGGGGHPFVGSFAFPIARLEEARALLRTIAEELNG